MYYVIDVEGIYTKTSTTHYGKLRMLKTYELDMYHWKFKLCNIDTNEIFKTDGAFIQEHKSELLYFYETTSYNILMLNEDLYSLLKDIRFSKPEQIDIIKDCDYKIKGDYTSEDNGFLYASHINSGGLYKYIHAYCLLLEGQFIIEDNKVYLLVGSYISSRTYNFKIECIIPNTQKFLSNYAKYTLLEG